MEFFRYILAFYALAGIVVCGGLLFNKNMSQRFLALFILIFSIGQFDFLYLSSTIVSYFPQVFMLVFPFYMLLGPLLWFHLIYLKKNTTVSTLKIGFHLLPFLGYLVFTIFLFTLTGVERLVFVEAHFTTLIQPMILYRGLHILFYGVLMIIFLKRNTENWSLIKKRYVYLIIITYGITALVRAVLTLFVQNTEYFAFYFVVVSTLIIITAYILYYKPTVLEHFQKKYSNSSLGVSDSKRISQKIRNYISDSDNIIDPLLKLDVLSKAIGEKKHHVSQTISEEFDSSFNDLINKHRIQYSKSLLSNSDFDHIKILAIALESGFTNKNTFNRAFIKFTKCRPSEFRKKGHK